jgi:ABC-2 type transport system permease protein
MPILDQGYQHWNGRLAGHAWRWLTITRQGARAQLKNRWVWGVILAATLPAFILCLFLMFWGLFEQKSSLLTPLLFLFQGLPEQLRAGPRGFRTEFWTIAFSEFLDVELFFSMVLVLLVGPELISQDLRFNAMPLYLSRPVRRIDYFAGKLGVIGVYLGAVTIVPIVLAFALGYGFSLDPLVVRDTWRVLAGALAFGAIVVFSAGTLMLAISSLSRNSRHVGAIWVGLWVVSGVASTVLEQTIHRDWCPLLSYTGNLNRLREALLDSPAAWGKVNALFLAGGEQLREAAGPGPFGRRRRGRANFRFSDAPAPPAPPSPTAGARGSPANDQATGKSTAYPWQWSAGVLAGLAVLSVWVLATRVRSLDRLR